MELLPISTASLGAMGSIAGKLDALQDTKLKKEISKLATRLLQLSKALDPPHTARRWMEDVRQLSYGMESCVDTEPDWIAKMPGLFKVRLKEANRRYDKYKLGRVPIPTDAFPIIDHRLPAVDAARKTDPVVVGLHDEGGAVDTLRQWLAGDGTEELKVVAIVGAGGIGKTTLAKQLWRDDKLGEFTCRAFVRTTKKPDMRRILRSILAQVRPHKPPGSNEMHELIHSLREHLRDKRYFLIIDDLWAISVWDVARRAFPGSNASRIITTTEIENVALACCGYQSKYIFKMEPLGISHSQEMFTSAGFGPPDGVSDEIIRRCAGLPQAIITISSVLASQRESNTVWNLEQIQNSLPTNTTSDNILKQVLNFCYNCLPGSLQTCLLYLSIYPENYIILKEDIVKQWVAEDFILAETENEKMEVAGSYFDKLVSMGLIQLIDVDYSDELLYYAVHHTIHDLITSKSTEQNFITVIDYSQRTVRFSNKVRRLSLQFGSATYATTPDIIGLSLVRSLAFIGLKSCFPPILEFKLLRFLTLHMWADQPSTTGVDLKPTSDLVLLRSLQVTCNDIVQLPDLMQGPKYLETLEINAVVAAIPSNIVHLRSWLHLRLGVGTELPDMTGILKNDRLNPPISLDESSSPPISVMTIELLPPICSVPKWIGQLTNLYSLKIVVRELDDISNLQGLQFLTVLSLHVQRRTTELIGFATGEFAALKYFEFRCGILRPLIFQKGTMPSLQSLKLGFNAHRGEEYGGSLVGIEDLLSIRKISGIIGVAKGAKKHDFEAAESAFKKAMGKHSGKVSIKRADMVEEEFDPPERQHPVRGQHPSTSVEHPGSPNQESQDVRGPPEKQYSTRHEHQSASSEEPASRKQERQELDGPLEKQHSVREKHEATSSEPPDSLKQEFQEDASQNVDGDSKSINRWSSWRGKYASRPPTNNSVIINYENVMGDIVFLLVIKKIEVALANSAAVHASAQFAHYGTQLIELKHSMGRVVRELRVMHDFQCQMDHIRNCNDPFYEGWLNEVRKIAHMIEDMVDEYLHQVGQEHDIGFLFYLKKWFRKPRYLFSLNQIVSNMKEKEKDLAHLSETKNRWGSWVNNGDTSSSNYIVKRSQDLANSSSSLDEEELVGVEKNREKLQRWLGGEGGECSVITMYGMGGLGKTALAANIYKKEREKFQCHAWVSISQTYSREDILMKIIKELFKDRVDVPSNIATMDITCLEDTLKRFLREKKYLIVLDDVWTPDVFDYLSRALVCNDKGSRLLITTRQGDVSAVASQGHILTLEALPKEKAWDLFCKKSFPREPGHECPDELKPLSKEIVSMCGGLPLAIVSVGSMLRVRVKTVEEWRRINDQLIWEILYSSRLGNIRNILYLSFIYLPAYLKSCFLYCSLFPQDYLFHRKKLIRLWVAEGFIIEKGASTVEEVAEGYLKELVSRNMLQLVEQNLFGRIKRLKMHDILRELAVDLCQRDLFGVKYEEDKCGESLQLDGRRLVVHRLNKSIQNSFSSVHGLRTFIALDKSMPSLTLLPLLSEKSRYMTVLELSGLPVEKIPYAIGDLFNLRHLGLRYTKVKFLPKSIEKLSNLLTLDLFGSDIQEVPAGIVKLKNLRHLFIGKFNDEYGRAFQTHRGVCIPKGLGNLINLQTLQSLHAEDGSFRKLGELGQLRSLRILNVKGIYCERLCESLVQMPFLSYLDVVASDENEVLMLSALPPNLRKLNFRGRLAEETSLRESPLLQAIEQNLYSLRLFWSQLREDPLPSLSRLTNLRELQFTRAYNGEKLEFLTGWFPKLKILYLWDLPNLKQLEIQQGAMATLERLGLANLGSMVEVPSGIEFLLALQTLVFREITSDFLTLLRQHPRIVGMQWHYSLRD